MTNKAFRRRPMIDIDGLSVAPTHEEAKNLQYSGHGVAALLIASIEQLNLSVLQTSDTHGFIDGVPFDDAENYDRALEIADRLLFLALPNVQLDHWRTPH